MNQSSQSRYRACAELHDTAGRTYLADRVPLRYAGRDDDIIHQAGAADTWWGLAERYYGGISERACGLWWVICDYQPQPVVDPTLAIPPGTEIVVPSASTVANEVLGVSREEYL